MSTEPKQTKWRCVPCNRYFGNAGALGAHAARKHHAKKSFQCEDCERIFTTKVGLASHTRQKHFKKSFQCKDCKRIFKTRNGLAIHARKVHDEKIAFACTFGACAGCVKTFKSKKDFDEHMDTHLGKTSYKCRFGCDKSFASRSQRLHHEGYKHGWKCDSCEMMFQTQKKRLLHKRTQHGNSRRLQLPFECASCKQCFSMQSELDQHIKNCCVVLSDESDGID